MSGSRKPYDRFNNSTLKRLDVSTLESQLSFESNRLQKDLMDHHTWIVQRDKIGLSTTTDYAKARNAKHRSGEKKMVAFIEQNFKKKECRGFVQASRNGTCLCGAAEKDHHIVTKRTAFASIPNGEDFKAPEGQRPHKYSQAHRPSTLLNETLEDLPELRNYIDAKNKARQQVHHQRPPPDSKEASFSEFVTDAFGDLIFDGKGEDSILEVPAQYLRLSSDSDMKDVLTLLTDHWQVLSTGNEGSRCQLVISLFGMQDNASIGSFVGKVRRSTIDGFIRAADATNALVLTDGFESGASAIIGDIAEGLQKVEQSGEDAQLALKLLGVTPWGNLHNRRSLINPVPGMLNEVAFDHDSNPGIGEVVLESNHTHFLLVDDGFRNVDSTTSIELFQRRLLGLFRSLKFPVLTLFVNGGPTSLMKLRKFLEAGFFCVVFEHSGGMADALSLALRMSYRNGNERVLSDESYTRLKDSVEEILSKSEPLARRDLLGIMETLEACIQFASQLPVFKLFIDNDLDKTILHTIFLNKARPLGSKLSLCLSWNRPDIAEDLLKSSITVANKGQLMNEFVSEILVKGNQTFLLNLSSAGRLSMRKFLTVERLRTMYRTVFNAEGDFREHLEHFAPEYFSESQDVTLNRIDQLLKNVLLCHTMPLYDSDAVSKVSLGKANNQQPYMVSQDLARFPDPYGELFIWSVLTQRIDLQDFFLSRCDSPLLMSLMAAIYLTKLANTYRAGTEQDQVISHRDRYLKVIGEVLDVAFATNKAKTHAMLEAPYQRIDDLNLMDFASLGDQRPFFFHEACQYVVHANWKRGFQKLGVVKSFICIFLPFLLFTKFVKYSPGLGDSGGKLGPYQKLFVFHRAPVTKFVTHLFSYLAMACLHSYVAMFSYRWEYLPSEWLLYTWILILGVTEFRELLQERANSFKNKVIIHLENVWNIFDFFLLMFSIFNFILKNFKATFWISRVLFATNAIPIFIQLFRFYHVSDSLGPKLVVLINMVPEIVTFLLLLVIFIMAYGVASQALIDPYRPHDWIEGRSLIAKVFVLPYWQMYGELRLEDIEVKNITACGPNPHFHDYCYRSDIEDLNDYSPFVPAFLALYLLFSNIMLLNMLIAVFTSVFDKIHGDSLNVWKWEMYLLTRDFDNKPMLPPPLVIFEDILIFMKMCCKKISRGKKRNPAFESVSWENLRVFEKACFLSWKVDKMGCDGSSEGEPQEIIEAIHATEQKLDRTTSELKSEIEKLKEVLVKSSVIIENQL